METNIDLLFLGRIWSFRGMFIIQIGSIHNKYNTNCFRGLKRGIEIIWRHGDFYPCVWIRVTKSKIRII